MARPLRFEPFDATPVAVVPTGPSDDWRAGHAQGLADAAAATAAQRAEAEDAALSALGDLVFTWAEARAALLAALAPFFRALSDRLVPEVAAAAFPLHLIEELARTAAVDLGAAPELAVSPDDAALLRPLLAAAGFSGVTIVEEASLDRGQARFGCGPGTTVLDTPALVAGLQEIVAAFLHASDTSLSHHSQGDTAHG